MDDLGRYWVLIGGFIMGTFGLMFTYGVEAAFGIWGFGEYFDEVFCSWSSFVGL